jgi:hypothetical protein
MNRVLMSFALLLVCCSLKAQAQAPSIADLQPPVNGGTTEVVSQDQISVQGDVVVGASAQDAVNFANSELDKEVEKERVSGSGDDQNLFCDYKWIKFDSGYGIVSKGVAVFKEHPNMTASLIAQRNAYTMAYTAAKMGMTRALEPVTIEGTTENKEFSELITSSDTSDIKSGFQSTEVTKQAANGLLKGYVIYSIDETVDPKDARVRMVSVAIASTPKTLQASKRSGAIQDVASLDEGLKTTMTEIKQGLVPPIGGRIITVAASGQVAVVGFGSAIVAKSGNRALDMRSQIDAQRISEARARDALVGMLEGDKTMWTSGISSSVQQEFASSTKFAVDTEQALVSEENVEKSIDSFSSNQTSQEISVSIRKGTLPPGIINNTWVSEDGNWAKTICIYYPDYTALAQDFSAQMKSADLLSGARMDADGKQKTDADGKPIFQSRLPPLPGGKFNIDDM